LPFAPLGIHVLGPSTEFYRALLPHFRETPTPAEKAGLFQRAATAVVEAAKWVAESWAIETLTDPPVDASSAENNTSVVLLVERDERLLLLTGDAGVPSLNEAASLAEARGYQLPSLRLMQAPHHGSRRNVGPTILNRILGPKYQGTESSKTIFVSAAKEGQPKHPSRKVVNAFQRRGAKDRVYATQGGMIRHHYEAPDRPGWTAATPLAFYEQVEE